jgi:hypothetical protein
VCLLFVRYHPSVTGPAADEAPRLVRSTPILTWACLKQGNPR